MTLPFQSITVLDPGRGLVRPSTNSPFYSGWSSLGTVGQLLSFSSLSDIRTSLGYGPLAEDVAKALRERGGPVLAMLSADSVADTISAVTKSNGASPTITVTGEANDIFTGVITCEGTGALGVGKFSYTLDAHDPDNVAVTTSKTRFIPAGGTFAPVGSGLTFTFPAGTYTAGDTWSFTTLPPGTNSTDLGGTATAIIALPSILFPLWILSETFQLETEASAMASALSGHLTTLGGSNRYARGLCDIGSGDTSANVLAEGANWSSRLICPWYGYHLVQSVLPFEGFAVRKVGCYSSGSARAARELISTDLARTASGNLDGVLKIYFDSDTDETLDDAGFATLRTWPGQPGFWVAKARLKSPIGSDFTDLHFGRIVDVGNRAIYEAMFPFSSEGFRTLDSGALDPNEKADIDAAGNDALAAKLLAPKNARGRRGHVSEVSFSVDPDHNVNSTSQILTHTAIRPLGYADEIISTIGFSQEV